MSIGGPQGHMDSQDWPPHIPVDYPQRGVVHSCRLPKGISMASDKTDVLHGSLALMVLRTLDTLGPQHGWGIARRIEQISGDVLELNQGTLYPALLRLEQMGWISSKWGASENNRRAKFYTITRAGKKQLAAESENWERISDIIARFLKPSGEAS
jgi:PadR family transcriptional regulator PadR